MSVCKLCMKSFKKLTPIHLKKIHGLNNREEYEEATKDIKIPPELEAEDKKLMDELAEIRRNKMIKNKTLKIKKEKVPVEVKQKSEKKTFNSIVLKQFKENK